MDQQALKDTLYAGIHALSQNRKYFYQSAMGTDYNHWSDDGKLALADYTRVMLGLMMEEEERLLNKRAKELVVRGLKGEMV
jgi:hypothetical protein